MYFTDKKFIYGLLHKLRLVLSSIMLLGLFILLTACQPQEVVDIPASSLDVHITINDPEENPIDDKVLVILQFFYNGDYVFLEDNTSVTCNGILLEKEKLGGLGYAARVPIVPEGGIYTFVHTRNGIATSVGLVSPERPEFISPKDGMTVMRSTNVVITYFEGSGSSVSGRASGRRANAGGISVGAGDQPDDGTYTGLNVISGGAGQFDAGVGGLSLTREYINTYSGGTGFNSVQSKYLSGSSINITWQ